MIDQADDDEREYTLSPLTDSLGFLTRVVQVQINDRVRASGGLGRSPAVLCLLQLVEANPGIRQVDAARILLIQESNMANLIKDLIAQGLIKRRGKNGGKRGGLLITQHGRRRVEQATSGAPIDRAYAAVLSDKDYQRLVTMLSLLYRAALKFPSGRLE